MFSVLIAVVLAGQTVPADPRALAAKAAEAYAAADYAAAADRYRQLVAVLPGSPGALAGLGRSLARLGRKAEAVEVLGRAADKRAGLDVAPVEAAFGPAADEPEVRALLSRLRANLTPVVASTPAFRLAEKDLYPESVAHDPADGTFYVGSLHKRKIVAVRDGVARDFVPSKAHGLGAVLGMKVDGARRELLANSCHGDFPPAVVDPEPARKGEAAVYRFSLPEGRLLAVHREGNAARPLCFNDLAFGADGAVFLSTGPDGVYRLDRATSHLERFAETPGLFVNGLDVSKDGRLLYLAVHPQGLYVLDVARRAVRPLATPPHTALGGIDGLYVHERSLVGVQNGLGGGRERVVQAFLDDSGHRVTCLETLERSHPDYHVPTTGVVVGGDLVYVAGSQLDALDDKGHPFSLDRLTESVVLRLPLAQGCRVASPAAQVDLEAVRHELLALHEADRLAHFAADAARLSPGAETFLSVSRGKIDTVTPAAERLFFDGYFAGARYQAWDDLEPPRVRVSDDGSLAVVATRLRVWRSSPGPDGKTQERKFVYAGIMTYERRDGRYVRTANVSTFE